MKKIFWSWPLLLVLAGGIIYMFGIGQLPDDNTTIPLVIVSILIALVGVLFYIRIKDKKEGKRYLRVKKRKIER